MNSLDKEEFVAQYRSVLEETKGTEKIVYVYRVEKPIPRVKGKSTILYIGRAKYDLWSRYYVAEDADQFWEVYSHSIEAFGPIRIDVYHTKDYVELETRALKKFWKEHLELPPMNRKG